jgi:hypothetical protein
VEDAVVTRCKNTLDVQENNLCFKRRNTVNRSLGRAKNKSGKDVFFLNTAEADANLLTTCSLVDFVFLFTIERRNGDRFTVRHHEKLALLLDNTGLNFTL